MIFRYEGVDAQGNSLKGELDAVHRHAALRQLRDKGVIVIELSEQAAVARAPWFTPRLTRAQLLQALHELTTLITSGVTLSEGIDALIEGGHHPQIEQAFRTMGRALQQGESFSSALAQSKLPLPDYLFHLVRAGEATGELGEALSRALEKMQFDQRTGNELRNALTYPIVLVLAGLSAVVLMFAVVVPKFTGMLGHGKVTLPWLAEMVLSTGEWFNANWDLLLIALILCIAGMALALRSRDVRQRLLNGVSRLPVVGEWLYQSDVASWSYTLAAMLGSRVELLQALELSRGSFRIPFRQRGMGEVIRLVRSGKSLSESLAETRLIARSGVNLVRVGEKSGRLAEMFSSLAAMYEENSKNRIKKVLALIEPLAILLIGSIIGVIILGIILAITSVNEMAV
jgi:general secretion pathway protein F